ncbi:tetratricopeptide repeat protein [Exilibacterium tricleocarpae]|nr:hypothetical protein [Exilibacterium tricleocarpae]
MEASTQLTPDELMHLALHATQHDNPEKALSHLKHLLQVEPDNGKAIYLMGALHAEIGMHEQAAEEMTRAVSLAPELTTARFQLGLLHITAGRIEAAREVWSGLDALGDEDPLYLFKTGLLHLVNDEFSDSVRLLQAGIDHNQLNEDLNNDMRRVMEDARKAAGATAPAATTAPAAVGETATASGAGQRMLLSVYERDAEDDG